MSLEIIDRHSEALFEFLWCPVCGHEVFSHILFEGVFCRNCNTQVELQESRETRGYEEAVLACFDTDSTWNLHVDEKTASRPARRVGAGESSAHRAPTRSTGGVQTRRRLGAGRTRRVRRHRRTGRDLPPRVGRNAVTVAVCRPLRGAGVLNEHRPNRPMSRTNDTHTDRTATPLTSDRDVVWRRVSAERGRLSGETP